MAVGSHREAPAPLFVQPLLGEAGLGPLPPPWFVFTLIMQKCFSL